MVRNYLTQIFTFYFVSYMLVCTHLSDVTLELSENGRSAELWSVRVVLTKKMKLACV